MEIKIDLSYPFSSIRNIAAAVSDSVGIGFDFDLDILNFPSLL
jgi:hypothetical protein